MKTTCPRFTSPAVTLAALLTLATSAFAAPATVTAQLDRADIALGDSAELTLTVSGSGTDAASPPAVPGLEFVAVGQSSQYQSINGCRVFDFSQRFNRFPANLVLAIVQ